MCTYAAAVAHRGSLQPRDESHTGGRYTLMMSHTQGRYTLMKSFRNCSCVFRICVHLHLSALLLLYSTASPCPLPSRPVLYCCCAGRLHHDMRPV